MKNKKLFAILTLVCFMFTLMPVAAFAASDYVEVSKTGAAGSYDDSVTVEVNNAAYVNVVGSTATGLFAVDEDGILDQVTTVAMQFTFDEEGTYKVYAADADEVAAINAEIISKAAKLELLMELDSLVDDYATVKVKASDVDYRIVLADNNDTTNPYFVPVTVGEEYDTQINANEGWDEDGAITATLQKSVDNKVTWTEVKGAELTFSAAGYVDVVLEDGAETDRGGDVDFEIVSKRAGNYTMYVKYGNEAKVKLNVAVVTSDADDVSAEKVPTAPVNIDQTIQAANIEFKFVDANNAPYTGVIASPADYKISVVSQPADSDMEGADFDLVQETAADANGADADGVWTLAPGNESYFAEEGEYTIKVTLKNGASATATVKVAEQGDITAIKFDVWNTPRTVAYGATTMVNRVLAVDANGVTSNLTGDPSLELSASGLAIKNFAAGVLTAKDDADYIGETITVMAVYDDFVATTVLTVVDEAAQIVYDKVTAEVGVNTTMLGTITDSTGKNSALGAAAATATPQAIVLEKPANAIAVADAGTSLDAKGRVVLNFLASEAGEYKVQTIVTYRVDTNADSVPDTTKYISSIETITVGAGEGTFEDVIVMSIGAKQLVKNAEVIAMPAAPEIVDSRTMVPARAGLEAFGATVVWDEATQTVTAELDGVKVVMEIGEKAYTVNGKAMVGDAAPYITSASTMVPVSFFTNAFGIVATPIYDDYGVCDVMFTK